MLFLYASAIKFSLSLIYVLLRAVMYECNALSHYPANRRCFKIHSPGFLALTVFIILSSQILPFFIFLIGLNSVFVLQVGLLCRSFE